MKKWVFLSVFVLISRISPAQQRSVSITIDDVPNIHLFKADGNQSRLLKKLDSIRVPIAIFINEGNLKQTNSASQNKELLKSWILKDYITVGNHTFSHSNYGDAGYDAFTKDVLQGEVVTKSLLKGSGKKLDYFRFPFNGMGKDSLEHAKMQDFLSRKGYINTPFTVESEDWLYTQLYEKAMSEGNKELADSIGKLYVKMTIRIFDYFDSLSTELHGRPVAQIYLCHDNLLNTNYLPQIIQQLKEKEYKFAALAETMRDPIYKSKDYYKGNAGFSWIYRWIADPAKRLAAMKAEPSNPEVQKAYENLNKAK